MFGTACLRFLYIGKEDASKMEQRGRAGFYVGIMRRRSIASLIILLAVSLIGCRSGSGIRYALRVAQAQMEVRPDSALAVLENVDTNALTRRSLKARHALLYSQALDKNYIDLRSDSVLAPAVAYYSKHGRARDKAYTNYYLGCIRYNAGQIDLAVQAMVSAETYAAQTGDNYLLARIYSCLGNMYKDQHSFEEADTMYRKAEAYFRAEGSMANVGHVLVNKAMGYSLMVCPDKAAAEYRKALMVFDSLGDKAQVSLMIRCMVNEMRQNDSIPTDTLKRLLVKAYSNSTFGHIPHADYLMWSLIYFREHNLDSARHFGERALNMEPGNSNKRCGMLLQMCRIEEMSGNYRTATDYWHEYYYLFDSIVIKVKEQLVQEANKRYRNRELEYTNELLRIRNRYNFIGWGAVSVGCFAALLLVFRRILRRYRQFIDVLDANYNAFRDRYLQLTQEMDRNSAEEAGLLEALEKKLMMFQQLLDKAYSGRKPHLFVGEFKKYVLSLGDDRSAFADLQYVVNKRCYGLVDCLRREHPNLTEYELNMLCMLQFGFSFDCIRLLHQHDNIYSLYSRRTKIHRKLNLPPRYPIESYLAELVERLKKEK